MPKTKKIEKKQTQQKKRKLKKPKKQGKKKHQRNIFDQKMLGRPKLRKQQQEDIMQNENFTVTKDPYQKFYDLLIKYLQKIGLGHGLVFRKEHRAKMNKKKYIWNQVCQWKREQQNIKIDQQISHLNVQQAKLNKIRELYLNVGQLFASQCTSEFYKLMTNCLLGNGQQNREKLYGQFQFLNGMYFIDNEIKIDHFVLCLNKSPQEIKENFFGLITDLCKLSKEFIFRQDKQDVKEC